MPTKAINGFIIPPIVSPTGPVSEKSNLGDIALLTNNTGATKENMIKNIEIPNIHFVIVSQLFKLSISFSFLTSILQLS